VDFIILALLIMDQTTLKNKPMVRTDNNIIAIPFESLRRNCLILAAFIAWTVLPCANDAILAQENDQPQPAESTGQQPQVSDQQEPIKGYPVRMRRVGTPMDVEYDLDNSFSKSDSLLELILGCDGRQQQ
jgi:hypothetical protein